MIRQILEWIILIAVVVIIAHSVRMVNSISDKVVDQVVAEQLSLVPCTSQYVTQETTLDQYRKIEAYCRSR